MIRKRTYKIFALYSVLILVLSLLARPAHFLFIDHTPAGHPHIHEDSFAIKGKDSNCCSQPVREFPVEFRQEPVHCYVGEFEFYKYPVITFFRIRYEISRIEERIRTDTLQKEGEEISLPYNLRAPPSGKG